MTKMVLQFGELRSVVVLRFGRQFGVKDGFLIDPVGNFPHHDIGEARRVMTFPPMPKDRTRDGIGRLK